VTRDHRWIEFTNGIRHQDYRKLTNMRNRFGAYVDYCGGPIGFTMTTVLPLIAFVVSGSAIVLILTGHLR
jgi:hypothetical protein